jgi:O-antigen ligase
MNTASLDQKSEFLYYGLLGYIFLYYTQFAGRYPVFAPFRLEFVLGSILLVLGGIRIHSGRINLKENKLNSAIISFCVFLLLSLPFAFIKTRAFNSSVQVLKYLSIYFMIICGLTSEKSLKGFLYVFISMAILLFGEPFLLSLQGKGFIYNNHMWRLAGVTNAFAHPNGLGITTSCSIPFLYYFMVYSKSKLWKAIFFSLFIVALWVIMLTQSRTGMVGVAAFLIFLWMKSRHKLVTAIALIICVLILWQVAPQETKDRFLTLGKAIEVIAGGRERQQILEREDSQAIGSMFSRWELTVRSFIVFKENPIFGIGMNNFISYSGRRWGSWFPPHNTYLQALAELGLVGTAILGVIIFLIFQNLKRSKEILQRLETENRFLTMVQKSVTGYFYVFLVVATFGIEFHSNAWWIAGGLSVVLLRLCKQLEVEPASTNQVSH